MSAADEMNALQPLPSSRTVSLREALQPPASFMGPVEMSGLLTRLRRRKLTFLAVFAAVSAVVVAAYVAIPASYRADAAVTIAPADRVLALPAQDTQQFVGDGSDLESQSIIMSSPLLLRELLAKPSIRAALLAECRGSAPPAWRVRLEALLDRPPAESCEQALANTAAMVGRLRGQLSIATSGRSRVINVSATAHRPETAQALANGAATTYLDIRAREKLQPRNAAITWLQDEIRRVGSRLRTNEEQIGEFLHANGIVRGQMAPISSEQLTSLSQQMALAEADRALAAGRMQQARANGGPVSATLDNRVVADVKQQLATNAGLTAQLSTRYGADYPALTELRNQRGGLERVLRQESDLVNRSASTDFEAATTRVATLRAQLDALKGDVRGNDDAAVQVASLQREAATDRELLIDLSKNLSQLETNRRLVVADASLVNLAEMPQAVFFPKLSTFVLAGFMVATALATGAALLRDRMDVTVRELGSLQHAASLRVLARIPHVRRTERSGARLAQSLGLPSKLQEAIRSLYAECLLLRADRHAFTDRGQVIMVNSSSGQEGKSFVTLALAHFAAGAGRRVLVLECDLRQPTIRRSLALQPRAGVTDILCGRSTAAAAVTRSAGGVDVITAGQPVMNSAELLGGPRLDALLHWARGAYDLVLIDTPPVRTLPDARVLAPHVDGVLFCAHWGRSHTGAVLAGIAELRQAGSTILGLVVSRLPPGQQRLYGDTPPFRVYFARQDA